MESGAADKDGVMSLKVSTKRFQWSKQLATFVAVFALLAQPMYGLVTNRVANAIAPISIANAVQLCDAIKNQADGQIWSIAPGKYGIGPDVCPGIAPVGGNTNKYVPLTANNLTISGVGNPTIYGQGFSPNGDGGYDGDFIAITGNNVTIKNLTVMTKIYPNKAIEIRGADSVIENVSVRPNTESLTDIDPAYWPEWSALYAGAIYYHEAVGTHTLKNVTVTNGSISLRSPAATFNLDGLKLDYRTDDDFLNTYRVYKPYSTTVVNGAPTYTYQVSHALNNLDSALGAINEPDTVPGQERIQLISDIWTDKQVTINKPGVIIDGAKVAGGSYQLMATFDKTDNSNNAILGIQASDVQVNNLIVDGQNRQIHGVNVYEATGVMLNQVTLSNNAHAGMIVGKDADVTVTDITTRNNGWYGINVDKKDGASSTLTVQGVSEHQEGSKAHIFIDNRAATNNTVNDPNKQYVRYWEGDGYKFVLDREKPVIALSVNAFNPTSFDVNATDDHSVTRVDYSIWKDGARIGIWGNNINLANPYNATVTEYCERVGAAPGNAGTCVFRSLSSLGEGVYTLHATIVDVRGKSTNSVPVLFTVDRSAPVVTIHTPAGGEELTGPVDVTASIADDNLSHYWLTITKDGSDVNLPNTKKYMYTDEFSNETIATLSAPGVYVVKLEARDKAGNKDGGSIATTTFTIIEDNGSEEPTDPVDPVDPTDPTDPVDPTAPTTPIVPAGPTNPASETPSPSDEDGDNNATPVIFLPATISGLGTSDDDTVATPLLQAITNANTDDDTDADVLGAEDTKTNWSVVNAALAGFIAILSVVALAGIRRKDADNNVGARLFTIVPAAAAVIAFFLVEDLSGSMGWFNVWTWLFAGILVVQAIVATLTMKTSND